MFHQAITTCIFGSKVCLSRFLRARAVSYIFPNGLSISAQSIARFRDDCFGVPSSVVSTKIARLPARRGIVYASLRLVFCRTDSHILFERLQLRISISK